jgi:spore coat polysaccharide biosynthesis protein SpsF (cytidylyltransferase family)
MKTGFFICARLGSTRLARKHLIPAAGAPFILHLVRRINHQFATERAAGTTVVAVIASDEPENRDFIPALRDEGTVFFGSVENIPLRQLQAARQFGADAIMSVDGDDILCSVEGMRAVHTALARGRDYAKTDNLPLGLNVSGYRRDFLETAMRGRDQKTLETGWTRIFEGSQPEVIRYTSPAPDDRLRFTLDYEDDARFFARVIERLGARAISATDQEIVDLVWREKIYELNAGLAREYWENFYRLQKQEAARDQT